MSRLSSMSPEAIRAIFSPESDADLITLVTVYSTEDNVTPILRIADGFTQRLSENADEVIYGVVSNSQNFIFIPMEITMPSEEETQAPRCSIVMNDVTRYVVPIIRTIHSPPRIKIEIVLSKTPNVIEMSFSDFYINSFNYDANRITADLSMIDYEREGFPTHSFTPRYFPGLF